MTPPELTASEAASIAAQMRRDGHACNMLDVRKVWDTGELLDREPLASAILQEFERRSLR